MPVSAPTGENEATLIPVLVRRSYRFPPTACDIPMLVADEICSVKPRASVSTPIACVCITHVPLDDGNQPV
jgi:hypothetical protein